MKNPAQETQTLKKLVLKTLKDHKGINIVTLDVRKLTSVTDYMIICSGTSNRHVKTLADYVVTNAKAQHFRPFGVEGDKENEWILVDLIDVVVHIMLVPVRTFYNLEKLWDVKAMEE